MKTEAMMHGAQQRAVTYLYEHDAVQAVMPMGSGKTVTAMTAIKELIADGVIRCALVLAPPRVASLVWAKEHKEWEHLQHLNVVHVAGSPAARAALLKEPADIYAVSIDLTEWLVDHLKALPAGHRLFDLLCIDELSKFRGGRSKRARKLYEVLDNFGPIWGLTGTPRPRSYENQWQPLMLLTKRKIWHRSFDRWRRERFYPDDYAGFNWLIKPHYEEQTKAEIARYSFTVADEDLPQLEEPRKIVHWVDLPGPARAQYDKMERHLLATVDETTVLAASRGVATGKLSQMANGFLYDESGEARSLHAEKMAALREIVDGLDGAPALIAYEFKEDLARLREAFPGLPYLGQGVSNALAAKHEADWNKGRLPLMALHPASAGHGLNLQFGGNTLIWYGHTWDAELYDQTVKRIHRQGSPFNAWYLHFIFARDTVDAVQHDRVIGRMTEQEAFRRYLRKI